MIKLLRKFHIFDGVEQNDLERIAEVCEIRKVSAGSTLFASGDPAQSLLLLNKGAVDLCCKLTYRHAAIEESIEHISQGEAFGWSALTPPFNYQLTARVVRDSELIEIRQDVLKKICNDNTATGLRLMTNIAEIIGQRVAALHRTVRQLIQQRLEEKDSMT